VADAGLEDDVDAGLEADVDDPWLLAVLVEIGENILDIAELAVFPKLCCVPGFRPGVCAPG